MIRVSLPWATFGLIVDPTTYKIREAAPIAAWSTGKPARTVWDYYDAKGAVLLWMGWDADD